MKNAKIDSHAIDLSGLSEKSKRAIRSNLLEGGIIPSKEELDALRQLDANKVDLATFKKEGIERILSGHGR